MDWYGQPRRVHTKNTTVYRRFVKHFVYLLSRRTNIFLFDMSQTGFFFSFMSKIRLVHGVARDSQHTKREIDMEKSRRIDKHAKEVSAHA